MGSNNSCDSNNSVAKATIIHKNAIVGPFNGNVVKMLVMLKFLIIKKILRFCKIKSLEMCI